jgi:AcrR family transcriptional regulator
MNENLKIEIMASQLGEARDWRQNKRTKRKLSEKDTRRLIIEAAERLFRQMGFQKTTVADIARELQMSPANIYRFFTTKSEINEAVCMDLLGKIEAEAEKIAASSTTAPQRIRNLFGAVEKTHHKRYMFDRKLYDLIEASITEKWAIVRSHTERMTEILEQIIASGMASGEFPPGDATLAAGLVSTACIRFRDPRLILEHEGELEPALDQMIDFCLAAIGGATILNFPSKEDRT